MRYCPGNDRASGVELPFRCHLSAVAAAIAAAISAAIAVAAVAVVADYFFHRIRDVLLRQFVIDFNLKCVRHIYVCLTYNFLNVSVKSICLKRKYYPCFIELQD